MSSPIPTGVMQYRAELPLDMLKALDALAQQYAADGYQTEGEGQAERHIFADGTLWFPQGLQKDNPATIGALVAGLASFILLILMVGAYAERAPSGKWLGLAFVAGACATGWLSFRSMRRSEEALRHVAMGTVVMPAQLLLVAYEEVTVIPRDRIAHIDIVSRRVNNRRTARMMAHYDDDDGERLQRYLGFVYGSDDQKAQCEEVLALMQQWLGESAPASAAS